MSRTAAVMDQTISERLDYDPDPRRYQTEGLHNYRTGDGDDDVAGRVGTTVQRRQTEKIVMDLLRQWQADTLNISSFEDMTGNKLFEAVVAIGDEAVPAILKMLRVAPSWIVLALEEITGEQPYADEDLGDLDRLTERWLGWGSETRQP